jgi:hypothetical protein
MEGYPKTAVTLNPGGISFTFIIRSNEQLKW